MVIRQGEIYWVNLSEPKGSEPGYHHPHIVIQNNLFNASRINTIVVISQIFTVNKSDMDEKIGQVSKKRMMEVLDGIKLLTEPRDGGV